MTRILVHFGLHKTGTSTAERTLELNAAALAAQMQVVTRKTWDDVSKAAKVFSAQPQNNRLAAFAAVLSARLASINDQRDLCISNVDLSGRLPGHHRVNSYAAVPVLVGQIKQCLIARFGNTADIEFMISTRPAKDWLKSLWWQNLKVDRLTDDLTTFSDRLRPVSDFSGLLADIQAALGNTKLHMTDLGKTGGLHLGPAAPVLAAMGLSAEQMLPLLQGPRLKQSLPADLQQAILMLNRSDLSQQELKETKSETLSLLNAVMQ